MKNSVLEADSRILGILEQLKLLVLEVHMLAHRLAAIKLVRQQPEFFTGDGDGI